MRGTNRRNVNDYSRRLRLETLEDRRVLAVITVDNINDEFDLDRSSGDTSLREAIFDAGISGDTIEFSTNPVHGLNGGSINLLSGLNQIEILDKSLTIDASMLSNGITIDAGQQDFRIFNITDTSGGAAAPTVEMIGLTLTGGDVTGDGGAIYSTVNLNLQDMNIAGNSASQNGGGLYASLSSGTTVTITGSTFQQNLASYSGGGIDLRIGNGSTATITGSTFIDLPPFIVPA